MDRAAVQESFSEFLSNRSLTTPQIRFIEMVIDQLTERGAMELSALNEAPFSGVHTGGPDALFAGKSNVIEGIFETLEALRCEPLADTGCSAASLELISLCPIGAGVRQRSP